MSGDAKATHSSLEGTYQIQDYAFNGKPLWRQKGGYSTIAYSKVVDNATKWKIGVTQNEIYSPDDTVGLLESNSWAYYKGSDIIFSTDIALKSGMY